MEYGYIRVSTVGQNIARQIDALHEAGIADAQIFTDKISGKDFNRPAWKRLVRKIKAEDVLVQSLDRLGRNYEDILEQWRLLIKIKGANIRERQRQGIDAAMKRGVRFGRPKIGKADEIAKCVAKVKDGLLTVKSAAEICHVSRATIRRRMCDIVHIDMV